MEEHIEIEGRVVRLLRHRRQGGAVVDRQVSLQTFLQTLLATTGRHYRLPVLPIGTPFILGRGSDLLVGVEQPPQVRHCTWRSGGPQGGARDYFHKESFEALRPIEDAADLVDVVYRAPEG